MDYVKSFEISGQDVYGDILSRRRTKSKIKVGLLPFGYFEYWRMFPGIKEIVENDITIIDARLSKKYNVICTDLVDTMDAADISGKILLDSEIDVVIVVLGTYLPDYITMHAINYVKNVPLLIFSAQKTGTINENSSFPDSARNTSMIGTAQLTATFQKIGKKYRTVVGSIDDDRAYQKIDDFLSAVQAVSDIKEANIGIIGNVFRGMYDIELSKTFLKGKFDVNVIYIQAEHMLNAWEQAGDKEVKEISDRLLKRFSVREVLNFDLIKACRLAVAMQKLVENYHLDALCLLDQHYIQRIFRTTARIGASILLEEKSIPVCCEGDIGGIVMAMLMQSISGTNPIQGEWCGYDENMNACLIRGHGVADPKMAGMDGKITLTQTPEDWGMEGVGLNYEFIVKPGICTVGSFLERGTNYSVLISKVESIGYPALKYNEIHALVKVNPPVKEYLERIFQFGVTQHCIMCHSDISTELEIVSDLLGLDKLII